MTLPNDSQYLVIAFNRYTAEPLFLTAGSLTRARQELPRYSESSGYQTQWYPRWATKKDTEKYSKEFKRAKLRGYEFMKPLEK
jgi:hypothetical protein